MRAKHAKALTEIPERPPWLVGDNANRDAGHEADHDAGHDTGHATDIILRASSDVAERKSVQSFPDARKSEGVASGDYMTSFMRVLTSRGDEPAYWSQARDAWLREFVFRPGNDLLLGTISTIASRVATAKWFLEGPERTVNAYQRILAQRFGMWAGWTFDIVKGVFDFLTQDKGWTLERIRSSKTDRNGAAIGFCHMDSAYVEVWTDPEYPVMWYDEGWDARKSHGGNGTLMHRSQVCRIIDMSSPSRDLRGIGLCSVSRAITTAQILSSIAKYEKEKLSDLPPAGILLLNNLTPKQWGDIRKQYDTRQDNQGNSTWRDLMVVFGLNPSVPLQADMLEFSEMPEHFDKKTVTEIAMYSFALAFNTDPRELWPVSAGTLGTATEANIQHMKAKAKGHGLILALIERVLNDGLSLPPTIEFKFDYQDVEEDERAARIQRLKAQTISILAGTYKEVGGSVPIVSQKQAQQWLVREGFFTADEMEQYQEESVAEDVAQVETAPDEEIKQEEGIKAKSMWRVDTGPRTRIWDDGKIQRIEIKSNLWRGWGNPGVTNKAIIDGMVVVEDKRTLPVIGKDVEISPQDVARALQQWDRLMPEYAGLLSAQPEE